MGIGIGLCLFYLFLLCLGSAAVIVPLFLTEIAPISMRGEIGALHQFASTVGILVGYSVGAAFSEVPGTWRWMMGIPVLFVLSVFAFFA